MRYKYEVAEVSSCISLGPLSSILGNPLGVFGQGIWKLWFSPTHFHHFRNFNHLDTCPWEPHRQIQQQQSLWRMFGWTCSSLLCGLLHTESGVDIIDETVEAGLEILIVVTNDDDCCYCYLDTTTHLSYHNTIQFLQNKKSPPNNGLNINSSFSQVFNF